MSLIPWKNKSRNEANGGELSTLTQLRSEMDRLFDDFLRDPFGSMTEGFNGLRSWAPAVDLAESDQEVTVRAEVPGIDPKDIDITVQGDQLTITGEKKESTEKKEQNYHHVESRFGSFQRRLPLPAGVDPQQVSADYAQGVLTIRLKKLPSAQPKKIQVKVAEQKALDEKKSSTGKKSS